MPRRSDVGGGSPPHSVPFPAPCTSYEGLLVDISSALPPSYHLDSNWQSAVLDNHSLLLGHHHFLPFPILCGVAKLAISIVLMEVLATT